jgi:hypothetical protein
VLQVRRGMSVPSRMVALVAVAFAGCGATSQPAATSKPKQFPIFYKAPSGHFSARFPSKPKYTSTLGSFSNYRFQVHEASVRGSGPVAVAEEDIQPPLPSDQFQPSISTALRALAIGGEISIQQQPSPTTYHHSPAVRATYVHKGDELTAIAFMSGGSRLYVLLAPSTEFDSLASGFEIGR